MTASDLHLLLVHSDDHTPVLPGAPPEATPGVARTRGWLGDHGANPNDLALQRWSVVAPEGARGDRLLALLAPLIDARGRQQGAPVTPIRVPPALADVPRWKKQTFGATIDLSPDTPRFVLIAGDLHEVPLAVQRALASDMYVGRLSFATDAGWEAYVAKLLRWERAPSVAKRGHAIFHGVRDGNAATTVGCDLLMGPALDAARRWHARGKFPAATLVESGGRSPPSPDHLLAAARVDRPSVLFSLSHGEGAPRGGWRTDEEQRRLQGALSFGPHGRLCGEDVATGAFLPGGVWFMFACFGAGTPTQSAFAPWLASLRELGAVRASLEALNTSLARERPFIAALPEASLANPDGPLAVVGHVDLAWTYGFQERDDGVVTRSGRFVEVMRSLLQGRRAGVALRELDRALGEVNAELTELDDAPGRRPADAIRRAHLWMLRQDLSHYVLLGDPAAHLPLAAEPVETMAGWVGFASTAAARPAAEVLEVAIAWLLTGTRSAQSLATEIGMDVREFERLASQWRAGGRAALKGS